ncbi:hypothetical protein GQ43DRAFT_475699 [Delitschia confertaspora ATCC 74209]|uniref:Uncharacterized protein n=1 Tax=Delitschia confertaspora ATCC 74209 TaxID=1513339 RepID=A0A9P4MNJ0_9PLEO|nr:hypothetical protein GQ43DRAFT_475699 [Delitschia confertaspora ATCC 74209]
MFLEIDTRFPDSPDFSTAEFKDTIRKIEEKKRKLEDDIHRYIQKKQDQLHKYEQELLDQRQAMNGATLQSEGDANSAHHLQSPTSAVPPVSINPEINIPTETSEFEEDAARRIKHTRVQKREQELRGVVTPFFLPLLEGHYDSPPKKKRSRSRSNEGALETAKSSDLRSSSPGKDAETVTGHQRSRSRSEEIGTGKLQSVAEGLGREEGSQSRQHPEKEKDIKPRRPSIKKSSLRRPNTPRERRKRVSLVIDNQIVHPSDNIMFAASAPSEAAYSSSSASTSQIDESALDPRLLEPLPHYEHKPVNHSLPLPVTLDSIMRDDDLAASPPPLEPPPPQTATRTFLDPSPPIETPANLPPYSTSEHIYATSPIAVAELEMNDPIPVPGPQSSYVGGFSGSNIDSVNQRGSYGYPSSLGASYMESYMQSRPLSVRIAATEKARLSEEEKQELSRREQEDDDMDMGGGGMDNGDDEGMGIMGGMEGF